jgi:phosphohistidine phosphatase
VIIVLMRHGEAVDSRIAIEPERYLTRAGRDECRSTGSSLKKMGISLTHAYSSPLVRAVQTAELVAAQLGFAGPVAAFGALVPSGSAKDVVAMLARHAGGDVIALITHEPIVRSIAAELSGRSSPSFGTASAAIFEMPSGRLVDRIDP